jgi:hypothetical protein
MVSSTANRVLTTLRVRLLNPKVAAPRHAKNKTARTIRHARFGAVRAGGLASLSGEAVASGESVAMI